MNKVLLAITIWMLGGAATASDLDSDFGKVCGLFEEALTLEAKSEVMGQYVRDNLRYRVSSDEIIEIYEAVFLIAPNKRYKAFKDAAEANTGKSWDCPAFKKFVE